jgi:hypothetical protein
MSYDVGGRPEAPGRPPFLARAGSVAWLLLLSLGVAAAASWGWNRPRAAPVESAPPVAASPSPLDVPRRPPPRPPKAREARDALRRVFGDALAVEAHRAVAGDFNDDGSEDLAVVVRAAPGMLDRLNDEMANWIVQDAAASGRALARVTVASADSLLAVIHGHGPAGWRNPEARQAYVVRNAPARPRVVVVDRGLAKTGPGSHVQPISAGPSVPHVLIDDTPNHPGFLYWSGSRYVWTSTPVAARPR